MEIFVKDAQYTGDTDGVWMDAVDVLSAMGVEVCATPLSEMSAELEGTKEALRIANEQINRILDDLRAARAERDKLDTELLELRTLHTAVWGERNQYRNDVSAAMKIQENLRNELEAAKATITELKNTLTVEKSTTDEAIAIKNDLRKQLNRIDSERGALVVALRDISKIAGELV